MYYNLLLFFLFGYRETPPVVSYSKNVFGITVAIVFVVWKKLFYKKYF